MSNVQARESRAALRHPSTPTASPRPPRRRSSRSPSNSDRLPATARREAIIRAALPLFAREGFYGVTTRELARAAGVSEALLFKHFPTKRRLYRALYTYCTRTFELDAEKIAALPTEAASLARLLYFVFRGVLIKRTPEAEPTFRLFCHSLLGDGEFARLMLRGPSSRALEAKFVACLRAGIAAGDVASDGPPLAARFWLARNIASHVYLHRLPPRAIIDYGPTPAAIVRNILQVGLRGIGLHEPVLARILSVSAIKTWETSGALNLLRGR